MSIHILGLGNLAKLLAHSIRTNHLQLPVTLLFHRESLLQEWEKAGKEIEIVRKGVGSRKGGFGVEVLSPVSSPSCSSSAASSAVSSIGDGLSGQGQIENLIVATKAGITVEAVGRVRERLGRGSTVLFLQNGIGTIDQVAKHVFPNPTSRPTFLAGILNHGVYATSTFSSVHAGLANAFIGPAFLGLGDLKQLKSTTSPFPTTPSTESSSPPTPSSPSFLTQTLTSCPELHAQAVTSQQLLTIQLRKLAVNATINPLTAIFNVPNGYLFTSPTIRSVIDALLREISAVIKQAIATVVPDQAEASTIIHEHFEFGTLEKAVYEVGAQTAENSSSMRQDVNAGRKTEIDVINGWVVRTGRTFGVDTSVNERVVALVEHGRRVGVDGESVGREFGIVGGD